MFEIDLAKVLLSFPDCKEDSGILLICYQIRYKLIG